MDISINPSHNVKRVGFNQIKDQVGKFFHYSPKGKNEDNGLCYVTDDHVLSIDTLGINTVPEHIWHGFEFHPFKGEFTIKVN
jgi:hypothetical protein